MAWGHPNVPAGKFRSARLAAWHPRVAQRRLKGWLKWWRWHAVPLQSTGMIGLRTPAGGRQLVGTRRTGRSAHQTFSEERNQVGTLLWA
jgi:hypothetical protein